MIVAWTQIKIEELGKCVVRVECSNCGCHYHYTLIRIGVGSAMALYSIGLEYATRSAQEQATDDMNRRLETEAELVPCPRCQWINESLIDGYRRGRYRSAASAAKVFAFIGFCSLAIFALIFFTDPAAARPAVAFFLLGGTALFWLSALAIVGLGRFLRNQIQPNRYFPQPPKLPPGVPTAHLLNADGGEPAPVSSQVLQKQDNHTWIHFRIGNDYMPTLCCDCLRGATDEQGYQAHLTSTMHLIIPRCSHCTQRVRGTYWRAWFKYLASGLVLISAVGGLMMLNSHDPWIVVVIGFATTMGLAYYLAARAIRPVKVRTCDLTRGVVALRFRNREYAGAVAKHLSTL